ncbi:MAG: beta-propeller domain-containing protein [Candidatus Bathyarchaeota archaeon]|nr:beta-propeller domain-containing protein [Candidatus Bathyarchaeota archaeon]
MSMNAYYPVTGKKLLSFALAALMIGSLIGGVLWRTGEVYSIKKNALTRFTSQQELVDYLKKGPESLPQSLYQKVLSLFQTRPLLPTATFQRQGGLLEDTSTPQEYSTTNIQVTGVDEADIVKTDGGYIYLTSNATAYILQAYPPEEAKVLSKLEFNTTVVGLFVNEDRLVVFQDPSFNPYAGEFRTYIPSSYKMKTSILIYDISDRVNPVLERHTTVDGQYFSSRMIEEYIYVVIIEPAQLINGNEVLLPEIQAGNRTIAVEVSDIYHTDFPNTHDFFTSIVAINVHDATQKPTIETFLLGTTSCLYVSLENIYLTSPEYSSTAGTNIHRINIGNGEITYAENGFVPGYVLNQFSMDEYRSYFRIATTHRGANHIYTLDQQMEVIGKLEDLAPGEAIYSTRFMGDRCFLVTFRKVDPLFVIDLEDPTNPQVLGKLKIPGYSDYLHPYDETHLIGVGKETVAAEEGDFAWYQGVKIALFDVSNVSLPKEIAKIEVGDRGTDSPVLRDHKAFLFDKTRHLLVLPILLAEIDETQYPLGVPPSTHGDYVYQGAYVFNVSKSEGIRLNGRITHLDDDTSLLKSGYYFSSAYEVNRALYVEDVLYTISDKMVKLNSLTDLTELGTINLEE